jgi:large subunit ribosomal protein L25
VSNDSINLTLDPRDTLGKQVRGLRRAGIVPAVIHDHGNDSIIVSGKAPELEKVFAAAGKHHPVDLTVAGKKYLALIKDVDVDPSKRTMRHVVFQAIKTDEKAEAEVPLHFEGEIPAERKSLLVITGIDRVTIEALPRDLPDTIVVDATVLDEVGDKITVADIKPPAGVTILTDSEQLVAVVEQPKDQEAEANKAAESLAADKIATEGPAEEEAAEPAAEGEEAAEETKEKESE